MAPEKVFRVYTRDDSFTNLVIPKDVKKVTPEVIKEFKRKNVKAKVLVSIGNNKKQFPFKVGSGPDPWISNAVTSLQNIIHDYYLDGIDVHYMDIDLSSANNFVYCIGELMQKLNPYEGTNLVASLAPNADTSDKYYLPLYQSYKITVSIETVVFQCFLNFKPDPDHEVASLVKKVEAIAPQYESVKYFLPGFSAIAGDWAKVSPPLFFLALISLLDNNTINVNGSSVKVISDPITSFPSQWLLQMLPFCVLLSNSMFASVTNSSINILRHCALLRPRVTLIFPCLLHRFGASAMDNARHNPFSSYAHASPSTGRGKAFDMRNNRETTRGRGGGSGSGKDKIDALGRLLTRILRHMGSELNLNMRRDGYVKVNDLLKLNLKTFANIPLRSHTIDDIREAVQKDNKQRFNLIDENGELLIRANQGHTVMSVETESLLKPILSAEEFPVCVHGTYRKNLESILGSGLKRMKRLHVHFSCGLPTDGEVISGMRRDVNVLIFLDVRKALEEGLKLYISDNKVILTEGFDGVVPPKYFEKIESWPGRQPIPF
ncbi:hypothetical protein VNO78_25407 [Psophocarpus tetragonolobus]|uniref:2'-phosphotransferase n=1 Tax=Psophocarpus tetragonolobus TaxID=3891 RepID=A0AAN9SA24_PSOTE